MNALEIVAGVFLLIACLLIIVSTMMQNPKQGGLGSSFGSTESPYNGSDSCTSDKTGRHHLLCPDHSGGRNFGISQLNNGFRGKVPCFMHGAFFIYTAAREWAEFRLQMEQGSSLCIDNAMQFAI
mgnify:CR=1 FL=1